MSLPDVQSDWLDVTNVNDVPSPALLVCVDRVKENIARMKQIAQGPNRLRVHIKTNKSPDIVRILLDADITKFKCATVAEAEMAADCGAEDMLIGYQPVGPNIPRVFELVRTFPKTSFSVIVDDADTVTRLSQAAVATGQRLKVFLDIDCGMHRSGICPGPQALEIYRSVAAAPGLVPSGLHAYDGHLRQGDLNERRAACDAAFAEVRRFQNELLAADLPVPTLVAGGTPTFPIHAQRDGVECSPGTCVLWDYGYATKLPDLEFLWAAMLLTRVVSKPGNGLLCLDLGHKAVASENAPPRVFFPELPDATQVSHSEEHLVVKTERGDAFALGDSLLGVPWHICPTVALHAEALAIEHGRVAGSFPISARVRKLTV